MARSKFEYDIAEIRKLCHLNYSNQEMADYFGFDALQIRRLIQKDPVFARMLKNRSKEARRGKPFGMPRVQFDLKIVKKLCKLSCTDEELAAYFKCNVITVSREKKRNKKFAAAIIEGRDHGKLSLRRKQIKVAMTGNPTMLIWLGKQYLLQKEKHELSGPNGGPLQSAQKVIRVRSRKA